MTWEHTGLTRMMCALPVALCLQWATSSVLQGPGDFQGAEEGTYNEVRRLPGCNGWDVH